MKKKITTLMVVCLVAGSLSAAKGKQAEAPASTGEGFQKGSLYLGGALGLGSGLGFLGGVAFMGNAEYAITNDIGIGASAGYWSYSQDLNYSYTSVTSTYPYYTTTTATATYKYSIIPVMVTGAWHFHIGNPKWDLAVGVALGYYVVSSSVSVSNGGSNTGLASASASGIAYGIYGQVRYFVTDRIALHGRLGYGLTVVELGVDFRI